MGGGGPSAWPGLGAVVNARAASMDRERAVATKFLVASKSHADSSPDNSRKLLKMSSTAFCSAIARAEGIVG